LIIKCNEHQEKHVRKTLRVLPVEVISVEEFDMMLHCFLLVINLIYLKNPPPLAVVMYLGLCRMINFDG